MLYKRKHQHFPDSRRFTLKTLKLYFHFFILFFPGILLHARSPFRPQDPYIPSITTEWAPRIKGEKIYFLQDSHLEISTLFYSFDEEHFKNNMLPTGPITFRNDLNSFVAGSKLAQDISELLAE